MEMPGPATAKEVQRFIGKWQYYQKFIPNVSQVAAQLFKAPAARCDFGPTRVTSRGRGFRRPWFQTPF